MIVGRRCALLALALASAACSGSIETSDVPLADLSAAEPPIADAVRQARMQVLESPRSAAAWGALADRYSAHGWHPEAAECYLRAERLDRSDVRWSHRLGHSLSKLDRLDQAADAFSRVVAARGDYAPAHLAYAAVLKRLGRSDEAREHYQRARQLDARSPHALVGLGQIALGSGQYEEARRRFDQAVQIDRRCREAHLALSQVYLALGNESRSTYHAELGRTLPPYTAPHDPLAQPEVAPVGSEALSRLGTALAGQGRLDEAEARFREALAINPEYLAARYNLGTTLARRGELAEAIEHLAEVVRVQPTNGDARVNLALALGDQGRPEEGEAHLREVLAMNPDHVNAHLARGRLLSEMDPEEAERHFREALGIDPDSYEAARLLAWLWATREETPFLRRRDAVRLAESACRQTANQHPLMLDALGAAYASIGRFDGAVAAERRAISIASSAGRTDLVEEFEARLDLYQRRRPYRSAMRPRRD